MVATMPLPTKNEEFDWRMYANCRDLAFLGEENPFFVEGYGANYPIARMYCSNCRVVIDCLLACLVDGLNADDEGMWGCMSPNERRTAMKQMAKGDNLKQVVERIWSRQRKRKNGSLVPSIDVWKEWNA